MNSTNEPTTLFEIQEVEKNLPKEQEDEGMRLSQAYDILKYALEKGVSVDVMERLLQMRRELRAEQAKEEYDKAMKGFQSECPIIKKDKGVPDKSGKIAYVYAPIESIEAVIRPYLQKYGFSHTFDTDLHSEQGWVVAKCIVKHQAGHSETSVVKLPLGSKTMIMSDTQVYAAAMTFANRRALVNAYGLVLADEDNDGRLQRLKSESPSSLRPENPKLLKYAQELWTLLKDVRGQEKNWKEANRWLEAKRIISLTEEVPRNITEERYKEIISAVKKELGVKV